MTQIIDRPATQTAVLSSGKAGTPLDSTFLAALDKLRRLTALRPQIAAAIQTEILARSRHHHHHHTSHDAMLLSQALDFDATALRLIVSDPSQLTPEAVSVLQQCRYLHPLIVAVVNEYNDEGEEDGETEGGEALAEVLGGGAHAHPDTPHPA